MGRKNRDIEVVCGLLLAVGVAVVLVAKFPGVKQSPWWHLVLGGMVLLLALAGFLIFRIFRREW